MSNSDYNTVSSFRIETIGKELEFRYASEKDELAGLTIILRLGSESAKTKHKAKEIMIGPLPTTTLIELANFLESQIVEVKEAAEDVARIETDD